MIFLRNSYYNVLNRPPQAIAQIQGGKESPEICGVVRFYKVRGGVLVCAEISGLPMSENQIHGFHIHAGTKCAGDSTDDFSLALGHYNPTNQPHPQHSGDLLPLLSVNGTAFSVFLTDRFDICEIVGKTVIIHENADDFISQPSGNAGAKIACGVITVR